MHLGIKLAPTQKVTAKLTDKYLFNKFISQIYFLKNKHFSFISVFNMQMNKQSETMDVSNHETIVDCIYCWIMLLFGWCKIATCNLFVSKYLPVKVTDKFWNLPAWFEKYPIWRVIAYYFIPWMHCFAPLEHWPCFVYTLSNEIINYMKLGY